MKRDVAADKRPRLMELCVLSDWTGELRYRVPAHLPTWPVGGRAQRSVVVSRPFCGIKWLIKTKLFGKINTWIFISRITAPSFVFFFFSRKKFWRWAFSLAHLSSNNTEGWYLYCSTPSWGDLWGILASLFGSSHVAHLHKQWMGRTCRNKRKFPVCFWTVCHFSNKWVEESNKNIVTVFQFLMLQLQIMT